MINSKTRVVNCKKEPYDVTLVDYQSGAIHLKLDGTDQGKR